jgi:copper chaperone
MSMCDTCTPADSGSAPTVATVGGMTCDHCATTVSTQIKRVPGVTGVDVDLETGRVTTHGSGFSDDQIRTAVEEAGYEVIDAG